jgi:SynChlorMet cassette protein ScmD
MVFKAGLPLAFPCGIRVFHRLAGVSVNIINPERRLPMDIKQEYPVAQSVIVLREEFDEWATLYNPDNADALGINPVGVVIWKLLDGQHTLADIAAEVKARFEEVPETAAADLAVFIHNLEERGFLAKETTNSK